MEMNMIIENDHRRRYDGSETSSRQHIYRTQVRGDHNIPWIEVEVEAADSAEANTRINALYGAENVRFRPIRTGED